MRPLPARTEYPRPQGNATLVVDCNKAHVTPAQHAALEALAQMQHMGMKCDHLSGRGKAMLVVDERSVPEIENVYRAAKPVVGRYGVVTDREGRPLLKIDKKALHDADKHAAGQFETYAITSGLREAVNTTLHEGAYTRLPAAVKKTPVQR